MLNISKDNKVSIANLKSYSAFKTVRKSSFSRVSFYITCGLFLLFLLCMFLPWTQNVQTKGYVTTILPEQRPQTIQAVIGGKINRWYVREGDFVNEGDTIMHILEVKSDYFDPLLIPRTEDQVNAKTRSIRSYDDKVSALEQQYLSLRQGMELKLEQTNNKILQTRLKISTDSIDLIAQKSLLDIAKNQYDRIVELEERGLKSLSELQEKDLKLQQMKAKVVSQTNKLEIAKNELTNLQIELTQINADYTDKISKSISDRQSAIAGQQEAIVSTSKLENQLNNYNLRSSFYYITAPQAGYITKVIKKGIGEIVKDGDDVLTIMPNDFELAVEAYVKPQDLPLLSIGNEVSLRFDGWPAIVVSGWPRSSTGIFFGKIYAIDRIISDNGLYRIFISGDGPKDWPKNLSIGTGAQTYTLLENVPIWYEIWRQLNGFPANYYKEKENDKSDLKRKAPLKTVK